MNWSALLSAFGLVFIAELGDKTQLAVMTQTCKFRRPWPVFFGGSLALSLPLLPLKAFTLAGSYVGSLAEMAELMSLARSGRLAPIPVTSLPLGQAQAALSDLRAGRVDGRIVLCP